MTRVFIHVPIRPAHRTIPLCPDTILGAGYGAVGTSSVVRQLNPLLAVLHHEVAVVDVGPPVGPAHHVGGLVAVVLASGQAGVESAGVPANFVHIVATVDFSPFAVIFINLPVTAAHRVNIFRTKIRAAKRSEFDGGDECESKEEASNPQHSRLICKSQSLFHSVVRCQRLQ